MDPVAQPALNTPFRCLGIDFSGDFRMWSSDCGTSNVCIAETESGVSRLRLVNLQRMQQLGGDCDPFTRLAQYLRQTSFDVAAIDAPFSIPEEHLQAKGHQELLELVASMELSGTKPFPSAQALVNGVLKGMSPVVKKPLRRTEQHWKQKGVNVRSTLWSGPRGGAAMTAACFKLLHQADCPICPGRESARGCLLRRSQQRSCTNGVFLTRRTTAATRKSRRSGVHLYCR